MNEHGDSSPVNETLGAHGQASFEQRGRAALRRVRAEAGQEVA